MKLLLSTLVLLFIVAFTAAADEAKQVKPNTLTAKEIADGWVLLFDGESTFGWKIEGEAKVKDGALFIGGKKAARVMTTTMYRDWQLHFESRGEGQLALKDGKGGTVSAGLANQEMNLWATAGGGLGTFIEVTAGPVNKAMFSYDGSKPVAIRFEVPAGKTLTLSNVKLKPLGLDSIFNGKDLKGWKVLPGHKSRFSVTKKGELNIKDGNGDIQTEAEWDDFVLQLDVFSNGPHLNSGVFFRCLPGQFWSGYEAQIRNEWKGDDRTKAVDYGTGGIYNRQPARKVVSSDYEWFTMTVVANGKHLAAWVNGYQTADFTDNRPADKSARKGCKVDKGPISLQGHDKSTDISFRNIRIAALPKQDQ